MADHRDGSLFPLTPKLLGFYHSLPPGQRGVFASIVNQASATAEVSGFKMQPPDVQEAVDDALQHLHRAVQGQELNDQALVFRDAEGALYALPTETLKQHRVSEKDRPRLEQVLGTADVAGFGIEISGGQLPPGLQFLGQFNGAGIEVDNGGQQSHFTGSPPAPGGGGALHGVVLR